MIVADIYTLYKKRIKYVASGEILSPKIMGSAVHLAPEGRHVCPKGEHKKNESTNRLMNQ